MKHNSHIYVASEAIELLRESVKNLRTMMATATLGWRLATRAPFISKS